MGFGFSIGNFIAASDRANKIRKEFDNAPGQFKAVLDEVQSFSIILQDADFVFPKQELQNDQKQDLENIDKGCQDVLDELQQILDKNSELDSETENVGGRIKRVWKRLNWKPEDIDELRSRISTNIGLLNAFNNRLTRDNVVKLVRHQENKENQAILDWLTPINHAIQQSDFISRRQAGTGQWLFDSIEFQSWLKAEQQTLFCPGILGAGKTILTAVTISGLIMRFQNDPNIGIAYLYCNFRRKNEQKAQDLLANLLTQLSQKRPSFPKITERFRGSIKYEIRAHEEDVRQYLDGRISQSGQKLLETYCEETKTNITNAIDGMFFLAQLHFEFVNTKKTWKEMKNVLKTLSTGPKTYEEAMKRIASYNIDSEDLAKQVLLWITCSKRPLTIFELQHALAVKVSETKLDKRNLPQIKNMISVYAGLVTIDKKSNIIRQEFPKQMTELHLAAYFGVKLAVQLLLEKGADIKAADDFGQTVT